jgi:hypothetical protein
VLGKFPTTAGLIGLLMGFFPTGLKFSKSKMHCKPLGKFFEKEKSHAKTLRRKANVAMTFPVCAENHEITKERKHETGRNWSATRSTTSYESSRRDFFVVFRSFVMS